MFTVGFAGYSGSGKTTLAEKVVVALREAGCTVSCIKDAHHDVDLDSPGKDTWRYRRAGADQVILRSGKRWALMQETPGGPRSLAELAGKLDPVDVLVVEGFKDSGEFPRIEVRHKGFGGPRIDPARNRIVAVASDDPSDALPGVRWFSADDAASIARFILALRTDAAAARRSGEEAA